MNANRLHRKASAGLALLALFLSFPLIIEGQTFRLGFAGGINYAELEGDGVDTWAGLNAGPIVQARLGKHTSLSSELLFSQNGEYVLPEYYPPVRYSRIRLNCVEAPVHLNFWLVESADKDFYHWQLGAGPALAYLFNHLAEEVTGEDVSRQVLFNSRTALLLQADAGYFPSQHLGFQFRGSLSSHASALGFTGAIRMVAYL